MTTLLEQAFERVRNLPIEEQDAIASQILACIESEEAWQGRFAAKRDVLERMAQEALEADQRGEAVDDADRLANTDVTTRDDARDTLGYKSIRIWAMRNPMLSPKGLHYSESRRLL